MDNCPQAIDHFGWAGISFSTTAPHQSITPKAALAAKGKRGKTVRHKRAAQRAAQRAERQRRRTVARVKKY